MTLNEVMKETAEAIREKTGKSELIAPVDFAEEIKGISAGGDAPSGGSETMYFAAKDGGAMGIITEMALMGGFAVKKADNTISSIGTFFLADDFYPEALISVKAIAFALGNYITGGSADVSNPDTLRGMMFQLNGMEGMPEIIEITKEQFYSVE